MVTEGVLREQGLTMVQQGSSMWGWKVRTQIILGTAEIWVMALNFPNLNSEGQHYLA